MSKAAESKHNFEPGEYPPKIDTDPGIPDAGLDFNPFDEDFFEAGRKIEKGEPTIEDDKTEETEKRSVREKIKNFFGFANKKTAEEKASLQQIEKGEIGSEGPVKLVKPELTELEALKARMDKANLDIRMRKLEGDAQTQLAALQGIFEGLASGTKHEEEDLALYHKLLKKGAYEKMNAEENAELQVLEGRPVTDKDIEKMASGEMPWTMNAAWKAMGKVRAATTGAATGGVTKAPFSFGKAAAFVAGAVAGSMIAGANPDRGRGEPKPDEPTIDVAMDDTELNPLRVETEAQLKKAEEDEKKLIKELENIEEQLAECREYEYQEGENNPDRLKFLESHLGFFPPFDPDRTNSKDPVIIVMDDETYLNEIFKPNFDKLPVGEKLVTLERLLVEAKNTLNKNKAISETNIHRVRAERERIKKELESIPKAAPKKPKQSAPAPTEPAGELKEKKAALEKEFPPGTVVKVMRSDGTIEEGWKVHILYEGVALVQKDDKEKGGIPLEVLKEWQSLKTGSDKTAPATADEAAAEERARLLAEAKARINKSDEPPAPPHPATVVMPDLAHEPKTSDAEKTKLEKEKAAAAIKKAVVMPGLAAEPKATDTGKGEREAIAKILERAKTKIADRAKELKNIDIRDLEDYYSEIYNARANETAEKMVERGYLTESENKKLSFDELYELRKELLNVYWAEIDKRNKAAKGAPDLAQAKEKDPRQKALHELEQYLIKVGDRAYDTVTADRVADVNAEINKIKRFDRGEYRYHLELIKLPGVDVALLNDDNLAGLRDVEIAKKMAVWGKAKELLAKEKAKTKTKAEPAKAATERKTATASAPEAPKPPDKGKEKRDRAMQEAGQVLEQVDRVVAVNLKAKIENMRIVENNTAIIRGMDVKSYRVHLVKISGLSQELADALTDEDIINLRNVEVFNADEAYKKSRREYLTQINKQMTAKQLVVGFEQINKTNIDKLNANDLIEMRNIVTDTTKGDATARGLLKILIDKINA